MPVPPVARRGAMVLEEDPREVERVRVTQSLGDLFDAQSGLTEQVNGPFHLGLLVKNLDG